MSYVRFSSADWDSDVYAYHHCAGGITVHVARGRYVADTPCPPSVSIDDIDAFMARHKEQSAWVEAAKLEKIGLSRDGETFNGMTYKAAADLLRSLKDEGYHVPQFAIDALDEEEKDNPGGPSLEPDE